MLPPPPPVHRTAKISCFLRDARTTRVTSRRAPHGRRPCVYSRRRGGAGSSPPRHCKMTHRRPSTSGGTCNRCRRLSSNRRHNRIRPRRRRNNTLAVPRGNWGLTSPTRKATTCIGDDARQDHGRAGGARSTPRPHFADGSTGVHRNLAHPSVRTGLIEGGGVCFICY